MSAHAITLAFQRRSARLRGVITGLLLVLVALLLLERFSAVAIELSRQGWADALVRRLGSQVVAACPEVFYLLALWWVRQALSAFAAGELYTPTIARALQRVGVVLAAGALIDTFVVPGAQHLLGYGPGYLIAYDVGGLVLGSVGLSLSLLAQVLKHASALQAELDEIF